jgi:peroxiredoxin
MNTLSLPGMIFLCLIFLAFSGSELIGTPAPQWQNQQWLNSKPLKLSELKGKVVLVRFFMESSCPMCRASAPYLNEFEQQYRKRGLVVIGMYTPKPEPHNTPIKTVQGFVKDYGFQFPVALDNDWATLNQFWLQRVPDAEYTSISFLIDKDGIIRYIHPGGSYSKDDVLTIRKRIEELIGQANDMD